MDKLDYSMSGEDILDFLECDIVNYEDLINFNGDLFDLLDGCLIILYTFKPMYGHWCLLFEQDDGTIEFFDSYGDLPDDQLKYIPMKHRISRNELYAKLSQLLYDSGRPIEYNNYAFQELNDSISTCGKWCIVRFCLGDLTIDEFKKIMDILSNYLDCSYDEVINSLFNGFH